MKYTWENKIVLFAEDDDASFVYLSELLKRNNVKVIRCSSGLSAFFYCMNNPNIDLVLMDMKLHELNGFEATRLIKKYQHSIPVIAVTACAMLEDRRRCKIAGCDEYLPKPIMPNDFLQLVHKYLSLSRIKLNYKEQLHF